MYLQSTSCTTSPTQTIALVVRTASSRISSRSEFVMLTTGSPQADATCMSGKVIRGQKESTNGARMALLRTEQRASLRTERSDATQTGLFRPICWNEHRASRLGGTHAAASEAEARSPTHITSLHIQTGKRSLDAIGPGSCHASGCT